MDHGFKAITWSFIGMAAALVLERDTAALCLAIVTGSIIIAVARR